MTVKSDLLDELRKLPASGEGSFETGFRLLHSSSSRCTALQSALTKAQRNALRALIPPQIRNELIRTAVEAGQVDAGSLKAEPEKRITAKQLEAIQKGIEATGTDLQKLLGYYKVGALEELTRDQASDAIRILSLKSKRG